VQALSEFVSSGVFFFFEVNVQGSSLPFLIYRPCLARLHVRLRPEPFQVLRILAAPGVKPVPEKEKEKKRKRKKGGRYSHFTFYPFFNVKEKLFCQTFF
jgi:hypothetical protein